MPSSPSGPAACGSCSRRQAEREGGRQRRRRRRRRGRAARAGRRPRLREQLVRLPLPHDRARQRGRALSPRRTTRLREQATIVQDIPRAEIHDGGRIRFGPDKKLYISTGETGNGELAQNPDSLGGKFLTVTPDAYRGDGGEPQIYSTGHRNPQGFDWEPKTGRLVATEHGPSGGDGRAASTSSTSCARAATTAGPRSTAATMAPSWRPSPSTRRRSRRPAGRS